MQTFPPHTQFKFQWRTYQERVLEELDDHLDDNHLHVIAPPGSGKTILGLEVMLRLNKPTVIFAPTIAIRNQWIQRFCDLFLQVNEMPNWISKDIRSPKFLTVSTYQGLHAAFIGSEENDEEEPEESDAEPKPQKEISQTIIDRLKDLEVGTIIVDEAHHLKNAWWESLTELKKGISPTVVGLTATPPYDVSHAEWKRYIALNGPVDAEISVPELVAEGDLCPHQDYVYFSQPTESEHLEIETFRANMEELYQRFKKDEILAKAIQEHPIIRHPQTNLDWIYSNIECYSASVIYLNAVGKEVRLEHLKVIGNKRLKIPELNYEWMEELLIFFLFKDSENFAAYADHQKSVLYQLRQVGAVERSKISLRRQKKLEGYLRSSIGKLESIVDIASFEHRQLHDDLRMVILSDFIRKKFLVNDTKNTLPIDRIGVLPIFERLRRENIEELNLGVLTGSVIILPESSLVRFGEIVAEFGLDKVSSRPLSYDAKYHLISVSDRIKGDIVRIVTQVFEEGHVHTLIGTKSLLGEGWDAPSINALILASFVGSFVLSNQMRGRAIRAQRSNPYKTGNIWHLVSVDPTAEGGGSDLELMKRRFRSFVGLSHYDTTIENGIGRLGIPESTNKQETIDAFNKEMFAAASDRHQLEERWQYVLKNGRVLTEEIKLPFYGEGDYVQFRKLYFRQTIRYFIAALLSSILGFAEVWVQVVVRGGDLYQYKEGIILLLSLTGGLFFAFFGFRIRKALKLYFKYRDISKDMKKIGEALVVSLYEVGQIATSPKRLQVVAEVDRFGAVFCHLKGGSTYEKSIFIKSMTEIVDVVESPRYIIVRKHFGIFNVKKDYHSVPEFIGRKKKWATYFADRWKFYVGPCKLVYTRTQEGRQLLLLSRMESLSAQLSERSERVSRWK